MTKKINSDDQPVELVGSGYLPQWSPDGETLAFIKIVGDKQQIETIKTGGAQQQLTLEGVSPNTYSILPYNRTQTSDLSWSPDSQSIAFVSIRGSRTNIGVVVAGRPGENLLTDNEDPNLILSCPLWSSDGDWLAYTSKTNKSGEKPIYTLRLVDAKTKKSDLILSVNSFIRLLGWTADNRELMFVSIEGLPAGLPPQVTISKAATATGEIKKLAVLKDAYLYNIHLSPDKKSIAFASRRESKDNIWLIPASGGEARRVTDNNDSRLYFSSLAWSPDGNSIFFGKQMRYSLLTMLTNFQ